MNTDDCLEFLNALVDNVAKTLIKNDPFLQFVPEEEVYQLKQDLAPKFTNSFVTSFFLNREPQHIKPNLSVRSIRSFGFFYC